MPTGLSSIACRIGGINTVKIFSAFVFFSFLSACELEVIHGSGSGTYSIGKTVPCKADTAPDGYIFHKWIGNVAFIPDQIYSSEIKYPIQSTKKDTIEATYLEDNDDVFQAEIVDGSPSLVHAIKDEVFTLVADTKQGSRPFDHWEGDVKVLTKPATEAYNGVKMPAADVYLKAIFQSQQ